VLNNAMDNVYTGALPEKWVYVSVSVAPSTITITEYGVTPTTVQSVDFLLISFLHEFPSERWFGSGQGRTGPPGSLSFATWAGWSAGQVGCHVKC